MGQSRVAAPVDGGDLLAEAEDDAEIAQVVLEPFDDLRVAEVEEAGTLLDDGRLRSQRGEHRRVLDADDAGAHDHHRGRDAPQPQQTVGVEDRAVVELDGRRPRGASAGGDHDPLGGETPLLAPRHEDRVRIEEAGAPGNDLDVVAEQLVPDDVDLTLDDLLRPVAEILHCDLLLHPVALAVRRPLAHAGQVDDRLAERLRRDRPPVDRHAAELAPLDHRDAMAQLRPLDGGSLPGGAGSDDQKLVVVVHEP
jgi:hypothetical protein